MKIEKLKITSKNYPEKLKALHKKPSTISIIGENIFEWPSVGIVGSRKVTSYGRGVTENFATDLARNNICIVSGLALGVDSIAHMTALKSKGRTIAVLPSGIKSIYPASHRGLARKIITQGGALISEYEDDFRPRKESFIQRNRIIAALSDVLLVTEAAEKSGSLHTANFALEMGKTVLAVPGNITSATSAGTNNLLKMGAIMATSVQDIYDALGISPEEIQDKTEIYGDNEQESTILNLLGTGISSGEELLAHSDLDIQLFQQTLTMLEMKGSISALGNNHWRLK